MNREIKENFYESVKKVNMRMTKPRKAMVEILDNKHLTFNEIREQLIEKKYLNVATMYNSLEFLIEQEVVNEVYIDGVKYYELALTNPNHDARNHIHFVDKKNNDIEEVYAPDILKFIERYDELKNIRIDAIKIIIEGTKRD